MALSLAFNPFTGTFDWVNAEQGVSRVDFTYSSGTLLLQAVEAATFLDGAILVIDTPFNDPSATLRLGTTADLDLVLGAAENSPGVAGQYANQEMTKFSSNDFLNLIINPGASTQGAGTLIYRYRR